MKLVVIILNRIDRLEDLLTAFLEIGVAGATVIDSIGMGHIVSHNIPIFAGLRAAFPGTSPGNKTILAAVEDAQLEEMREVITDVCGSFEEQGNGLMLSLSIDEVFGFRPNE